MTDEELRPEEDLRHVMNGLLSTLSHDLRTPLSAIAGWLFLLESDKLDADAKKRALAKIRANVKDQVQLIDDVALLSRSRTGHLQMYPTLISPLGPLETALANVRPAAIAGAIDLKPIKVIQTGEVMADEERLLRVFEILLSHAIKTTPSGGNIDTSVSVRDQYVEITLSDDGKGVSQVDLPYLFDAFRKEENAEGSAYPGAERSLMLARALVEKQGGLLHASSRGLALGTTFTLQMPIVHA